MAIEKNIRYEEGVQKAQILADLKRRYEKAKEGGYKGNIREFILKEKHEDILNRSEFSGGGNGKANGVTTFTADDWDLWLQQNDPNYITEEEEKNLSQRKVPNKLVAYKFGATSQKEEDMIGGHIDDWTNAINKGELDPSVDFMKYLNLILGRDSVSRGGIVSII